MVIFQENNKGKFAKKDEIIFGRDEDKYPEQELENLIIDNPNIIPVQSFSSDSSQFIPLAKQIDLSHHGRLDILGVDNVGNIYIIECKITTINADKKSIRGQITDYTSGLWSKKDDWEFFNKSIRKTNSSPTTDIQNRSFANMELEQIITEKFPEEHEKILENIKDNFKKGKYFLIFAVDKITIGMRETIDFHNQAIDGNEKYPMFGIEIKKYSGNENDNFISTQIYPFNSEELRKKSENNSNRYNNNQDKWDEQFDSTELSHIEKEQILQFKTELKKLIKDDEGEFVYGTGKTVAMAPRFTSSPTRSAIILYADGVLKTQLAFLEEEYGILYEELKNQFRMLDYVKKRVQLPNGRIEFSSDPADWLPHRDEILPILDKVLVKS
jgi:hypothetical protein